MNVRVVVLVVVSQRLDHGARLLGGSRIIEVNQRMAMDLLGEDREIFPHCLPIYRTLGALMHTAMWGKARPASLASLH
jgi:hypothetical protein